MTHRLSRIQGFHMHAIDGEIGHVDDFLIDETSWQVKYLVVDTNNWIGGKWVAIPTTAISRVDWADESIHVALTRSEIKAGPTLEEAQVPNYELSPPFFIM